MKRREVLCRAASAGSSTARSSRPSPSDFGWRQARGLTQRDLATRAHVTLSYVSRLESGGAAPGIDLLERLATALQVGLNELLPEPAKPPSLEAQRARLRDRLAGLLPRLGPETIGMIESLLSRLAEAPGVGH